MRDQISGKILTCSGGLYRVETSEGIVECYAKGSFRHDGVVPVPGDQAVLRTEGIGDKKTAYLTDLLNRKNCLLRPPVANLDRMFLVCSVTNPEPSLLNFDKICSVCCHNEIEVVLIFSKSDLDEEKGERLKRIYQGIGFPVFLLNMQEKEKARELLLPLIQGVSSAFTGASGVGKSTLMNLLFPELKLNTGDISRKISRGKNTTRQSEFYNVSCYTGVDESYLADTPGFSQLDFRRFHFMEKEELADSFPEFREYIGTCRYTKCTHQKEEGCSILSALEQGALSPSRHESYCKLYQDLAAYKKWK